jgi:uncharacterized protein
MTSSHHNPFHIFPSSDSAPIPGPSTTSFEITVPHSHATDIWQKPANALSSTPIKTFNAPLIYKIIKLKEFHRARVTISANFERLYDQGGLVFILPGEERKWIKTGIEFYSGDAYVSTVACDRWADWSLVQTGIRGEHGRKSVTIEAERNPEEGTLWLYIIDGEKRIPIREVTWVLSEGDEKEVWVGVYAATPTVEGRKEGDGLKVSFEEWELEVGGS